MLINGHFLLSTVSSAFRYFIVFAGLALSSLSHASFSQEVVVEGDPLPLRGESSFSWLFFDLYDAALYLPRDAAPSSALDNIPKKLVIKYKREVPSDKIIEAGNTLLKKNCLPAEFESIRASLDQINAAYQTPQKGDTYALSFHPVRGSTILYFNDEAVATIEGEVFANLYFRIWLGEHPVSDRFRDELLQAAI